MRIAILSCGACVVKYKDQVWLFGAPEGVDVSLKEAGIDTPKMVFLTQLRSPGYAQLAGVVSFKEKPLNMDGLSATPIKHKHGTDYLIKTEDAYVLFSERGDVATKDLEGVDLAVIRNKNRADAWGDNVITWPWPDAEYVVTDNSPELVNIALKVWSSLDQVPSNIKTIDGVPLTLAQANQIARVAKASGEGGRENWAIAVDQFKSTHTKGADGWAEKKSNSDESSSDDEASEEKGDKRGKSDVKSEEKDEEEKETATKAAKLSKSAADYRPSQGGNRTCGNCEYYTTGSCAIVEGDIDPDYLCSRHTFEEGKEPPVNRGGGVVGNAANRYAAGGVSGLFKEAKKDGEGRTASDYLIAEDSDKPSSWHLPVAKNGKLDRKLMGAAAAALAAPGGHRGNKYQGPDKDKAIRKLMSMYRKEEGADVPKNLEDAFKRLKEYTAEGPVRRFGDVLVAALHTAYNDVSDGYYSEGFMTEEERKSVGSAIGSALDALREAMPAELQQRPVDKLVAVPDALKELLPSVPDEVTIWSTVYKDEEGHWNWASVTSAAVWDGHNELVTPQAMDYAIGMGKVLGRGPLRFKHAPGLDGGECTHQAQVGGFLFERGIFYDNPIGQAMRRAMQEDPTWMISPGLAFAPKDLHNGVFSKCLIFERSMTKIPANRVSSILNVDGGYEMALKELSREELKQVADELELDLKYVERLHKQALQNDSGGSTRNVAQFKEWVLKEGKKKRTGDSMDYEDEDEEGMDEEEREAKAKEILAGLGAEQRETLKHLLDETEPPEVRLRAEMEELSQVVKEQGQTIDKLTALLANQARGKSQDAGLEEFFASLPRRQAAQFGSQVTTKEEGGESELSARDKEILATLKEIKDQMASPLHGSGLYDTLTSKRLNPPAREQ